MLVGDRSQRSAARNVSNSSLINTARPPPPPPPQQQQQRQKQPGKEVVPLTLQLLASREGSVEADVVAQPLALVQPLEVVLAAEPLAQSDEQEHVWAKV